MNDTTKTNETPALSYAELADLTHATQVQLFGWCICEDNEGNENPYADCTPSTPEADHLYKYEDLTDAAKKYAAETMLSQYDEDELIVEDIISYYQSFEPHHIEGLKWTNHSIMAEVHVHLTPEETADIFKTDPAEDRGIATRCSLIYGEEYEESVQKYNEGQGGYADMHYVNKEAASVRLYIVLDTSGAPYKVDKVRALQPTILNEYIAKSISTTIAADIIHDISYRIAELTEYYNSVEYFEDVHYMWNEDALYDADGREVW